MVSRRKILSRSRDDLNLDLDLAYTQQMDDEEDIWYQKDKLFKVSTHNLAPLHAVYGKVMVICTPKST